MPQTYTFASWNVNGLRAVLKKDPSFIQIAQELDVDILALQETKLQEGQVDIDLTLVSMNIETNPIRMILVLLAMISMLGITNMISRLLMKHLLLSEVQ